MPLPRLATDRKNLFYKLMVYKLAIVLILSVRENEHNS
jgi:hypothetical protein